MEASSWTARWCAPGTRGVERPGDAPTGTGNVVGETIRLEGDRARIDFDGGQGRRGRLLVRGAHRWLVLPGLDTPLQVSHLPLGSVIRLDPSDPCLALNLVCERVGDRLIAGHRAHGWRYAHAGHAGPGGTDRGVFWLDARYGVLLAFRARSRNGLHYRMTTAAIRFGPLPPATFALRALP